MYYEIDYNNPSKEKMFFSLNKGDRFTGDVSTNVETEYKVGDKIFIKTSQQLANPFLGNGEIPKTTTFGLLLEVIKVHNVDGLFIKAFMQVEVKKIQ